MNQVAALVSTHSNKTSSNGEICAVGDVYAMQKNCLRENFVSPEEIERAFGCSYTEENFPMLNKRLRNEGFLQQCVAEELCVFPKPPFNATVLSLLEMLNGEYQAVSEPYNFHNEHFARLDCILSGGWIVCEKKIITRTLNTPWSPYSGTYPDLSLAEVLWFLMVERIVRGTQLLNDHYVWTSVIDSRSKRVIVGCNNHNRLRIKSTFDFSSRPNIGKLGGFTFS